MFNDKNLILVCGSGGVGKTTLSAAIALKAAQGGRKVIVLTIDPAKRLASSLGLNSLSSEPQRISTELHFDAMMLDTKRTFDQLVIKYSPSREIEKKILGNKIYRHFSDMIAGSQEYMAMEKLHEIVSGKKYDLVVVDTPPTVHAIDFLEAPEKMVGAITDSMLHLLLKPALAFGRSSLKLIERGGQILFKVFDRITGFAFLQDISEMLISFQDLLGGFKDRASEVRQILSDKKTAFVLVSVCEEKSVEETRFFIDKLQKFQFPLSGLIVNRVCPLYSSADRDAAHERLRDILGLRLAPKVISIFDRYQAQAARDKKFEAMMKKMMSDEMFFFSIPLFESDIHDLAGLNRIGSHIDL